MLTTDNNSLGGWLAIIDCSAQNSQLIARQIRKNHVYCELCPHTTPLAKLMERQPKGLILAGEAAGAYADGNSSVPVLRINFDATIDASAVALKGNGGSLYTLELPTGMVATQQCQQILQEFAADICGCKPEWTMSNFIKAAVAEIKEKVGSERVLCALSGGVDSSVAAALVQRAIGEQLTCVFVNHGFMRQGEPEQVSATFSARMGENFVPIDASERFLSKLTGVSDPEQKRKLIGEEFIRVFEEEARRYGQARYLVQGTLYPDVIESGTASAGVIKSHHNVGGLPEHMELDLIEPLRQLYKDEVRELGMELGLPAALVWRQPFPGPGLAIRTVGEITRERVQLVRRADAIVVEEIEKAGLAQAIWQYFAIITDTKSVGMINDERNYGYVVAIRAVDSKDAMTANWVRLPYEVLDRISSRIMNEVKQISRVVYDISSKPPATICWE